MRCSCPIRVRSCSSFTRREPPKKFKRPTPPPLPPPALLYCPRREQITEKQLTNRSEELTSKNETNATAGRVGNTRYFGILKRRKPDLGHDAAALQRCYHRLESPDKHLSLAWAGDVRLSQVPKFRFEYTLLDPPSKNRQLTNGPVKSACRMRTWRDWGSNIHFATNKLSLARAASIAADMLPHCPKPLSATPEAKA